MIRYEQNSQQIVPNIQNQQSQPTYEYNNQTPLYNIPNNIPQNANQNTNYMPLPGESQVSNQGNTQNMNSSSIMNSNELKTKMETIPRIDNINNERLNQTFYSVGKEIHPNT
jgi:hypothetical protein